MGELHVRVEYRSAAGVSECVYRTVPVEPEDSLTELVAHAASVIAADGICTEKEGSEGYIQILPHAIHRVDYDLDQEEGK